MAVAADIHVFDLSANPGLLTINSGPASIQTGSVTVIHLINLQGFEIMLNQIENLAGSLDKTNDFRPILETKIFSLKKTFKTIAKNNRYKRSWEALGSGIKWIAGNADADDLREINKNFEKIVEHQNKMTQNNNKQEKINEIFEDKLNEIIITISQSISSGLNETFDSLKFINLMFNIDLAKEKLNDIHEAITLTKIKVVPKNIFEEQELKLISNVLKIQNLEFESLSEMLNYLQPQIAYNDDIIEYRVAIPQVENGFTKIYVEPLTINDKEIKIDYNEVLIKNNKTFSVTKQCIEFVSNTLCVAEHLNDISEDSCIPQLARNNHGNCTFMTIKPETTIKSLRDGNLLIRNANSPIRMENSCGMPNHTVSGSFLISFSNCSVTINNQTFKNIQYKTRGNFEILPMFNISIKQKDLHTGLHELGQIHIKNLEKLDEMHVSRIKERTTFVYIMAAIGVIIAIIGTTVVVGIIKIYKPAMPSLPTRDVSELKGEKLMTSVFAQ